MVKIERNPVPPPSLAIEVEKAKGVYNKPDVIQRLKEDSNDKCYICELKGLSDPEVEHLRPHHGRKIPGRVFDWNNLFYACPHCNNIKKETKYDDKIIDCCVEDPEIMIEQCYENGHVKVHNIVADECAAMTAELIQDCFEKRNTGIREAACQYRIDRLAEEMNVLYKTLEKHKRNPELQHYKRSLKAALSRTSIFAAFKRNYVRKHIGDYPALEEFLV
ncbi:MAG: HNH endonuclease [Lachnospiraceae bacterium]